jgi:hypothetical protein
MNGFGNRSPRRASYILACLVLTALSAPVPSGAQGDAPFTSLRTVNLDSPTVTARSTTRLAGDVRLFGASEDLTYINLELGYGLRDNLELILRGVAGDERTYSGSGFTIRHGGHDVELALKLGLRPSSERSAWALLVGLSAPQTPAQNSVYPTLQFLSTFQLGSRTTLHFVPKAVFVEDDPIIGIGGGVTVQLGGAVELSADITGLISGNNTYSLLSGTRTRGEVWGVMLRHRSTSSSGELAVELGVTNGIGRTTGFSLTPGLGGSAALVLGLTWRR